MTTQYQDPALQELIRDSETLREILNPSNTEWDKDDWFRAYKDVGLRLAGLVAGLTLAFYPAWAHERTDHSLLISGSGISLITAAVALNGQPKQQRRTQ